MDSQVSHPTPKPYIQAQSGLNHHPPTGDRKQYARRLISSFGISIVLNLILIWILLSPGFQHWISVKSTQPPKSTKLPPKILLIQRTPPPATTPPPQPNRTRPQTFLETDPSQALTEKPKTADFYSEHNTLATQTEASPLKSGEIPKSDGSSTRSMATENVRPSAKTSPPPGSQSSTTKIPEKNTAFSPPNPQTPPPDTGQTTANSKSGDITLTKLLPTEKPSHRTDSLTVAPPTTATSPTNPTPETPRRGESSPDQPPSTDTPLPPGSNREIATPKSKLEGGVPRVGAATAFNSASSPFASYDKKIVAKISGYWHGLLENKFYGEVTGEVEVSFKLLSNGKITDLHIVRNTANTLLAAKCIQAIERASPFNPFPDSIRTIVGDSREGSITFAY